MTAPSAERTDVRSSPRGCQFSLRTLFAVTTFVAVACTVYFALPPPAGVLLDLCLVVSTPVVLAAMVIYGRQYVRTFAMGALIAAGVFLFPAFTLYGLSFVGAIAGNYIDLDDPDSIRFFAVTFVSAYYFLVLGNGLLAVLVRRLVEPREPAAGKKAPEERGKEDA
jgi:hypothetical protein